MKNKIRHDFPLLQKIFPFFKHTFEIQRGMWYTVFVQKTPSTHKTRNTGKEEPLWLT